jgi:dsDNA-specific endonuclease/ATPase MutS2
LTEINGLLKQQQTLERDGTLSKEDINENLEKLAAALKWKAHKDPQTNLQMLRERLQTNHDVAQHFTAVLQYSAAIQAFQGLGPVNYEFKPEELLQGAKDVTASIQHINPKDREKLSDSLKQSLDARDQVQKQVDGKTDKNIQKLLKKNEKGITDTVKTFLQEQRFISEIQQITGNLRQDPAAFRQQLEGAFDIQDDARDTLANQRITNLTNLGSVKQHLTKVWDVQKAVLADLMKNTESQVASGYFTSQTDRFCRTTWSHRKASLFKAFKLQVRKILLS